MRNKEITDWLDTIAEIVFESLNGKIPQERMEEQMLLIMQKTIEKHKPEANTPAYQFYVKYRVKVILLREEQEGEPKDGEQSLSVDALLATYEELTKEQD